MVTVSIAAFLAIAPIAPPYVTPEPLPQARPAMWVARDDDTTVYLFGTFHALDGRSHWFDREIRQAFSNSDELVLETILPARPPVARAAPRTLSIQGYRIAPGASVMATTRIAVSAARARGMDVHKGADMVLRRAAEADGKTVEGLETVDFQLGMYQRMAPIQAHGMAAKGDVPARAHLGAVMALMQAAWNRGDQHIFAALLGEMRQTSPDNYRLMFPERNALWADWIVNRMDQPGTVFVAVGAGHFAGPDSLLSKLTLKGVVATRAN